MDFFYKKANLLNLLVKTLSLIKKSDRKNFIYLIFFLIIQSILDVISIASIIPLLYLLEGKETRVSSINNFFLKYGINSNLYFGNKLTIYIPIIVIILMIISTVGRLFIVFKTNYFIEKTRHSISTRLMQNYINNKYENNEVKSEVAKSILSEVDQFIVLVFQPVMWMITNIILLVGIIFYLLYTNLKASFVSIFLLGFFYAIFYLFTKEILNIQGIKSESSNKGRFRTAIEIFESIRDIKIYSAENFFEKRFKIFSKEFANTNSTYSSLVASPKYLLEMIVFVALAITILLLTLNNSISINSIPLLGTFAFAAYKAQPALSNVIYGINSLEYGSKIISNLFKKINLKKTDYYSKTKISFKSLSKKNSYCLLIKNLCYKYNNKEIMKDLDLEIDFPSLFIVAGESGSGKSTLLNLIAGLLKPQKGEIIFNKDLFNKRKPKISYLHQNHTLYDTSISENIAFGIKREEIDYKLINLILKEVRILDFVNSLKDKHNTKVGENGSNLSVGQLQRVAIARALYFEPDILILDEPTSALDKNNAEELIETIMRISKKICVIISTHQLNYFPSNSNVFFMENKK